MRIGITSQNLRTITGHAGKTRRFLAYESKPDGSYTESAPLKLPKEMSMHEFEGDNHPIDEFDILVTASCGQGFIKRMHSRGVGMMVTSETDPVKAVVSILKGEDLPPPLPHDHDHSHH